MTPPDFNARGAPVETAVESLLAVRLKNVNRRQGLSPRHAMLSSIRKQWKLIRIQRGKRFEEWSRSRETHLLI